MASRRPASASSTRSGRSNASAVKNNRVKFYSSEVSSTIADLSSAFRVSEKRMARASTILEASMRKLVADLATEIDRGVDDGLFITSDMTRTTNNGREVDKWIMCSFLVAFHKQQSGYKDPVSSDDDSSRRWRSRGGYDDPRGGGGHGGGHGGGRGDDPRGDGRGGGGGKRDDSSLWRDASPSPEPRAKPSRRPVRFDDAPTLKPVSGAIVPRSSYTEEAGASASEGESLSSNVKSMSLS
jgi:hypothetical protein